MTVSPLMFLESINQLNNLNYLIENKNEYISYTKNNLISYLIGFLGGIITLIALNFKK